MNSEQGTGDGNRVRTYTHLKLLLEHDVTNPILPK